jgi:hypothetical protein
VHSRADAWINFSFAVTLMAPLVAWVSFRLAHAGHRAVHRRIQLGLLAVCVLGVLTLETRIRMAGGSGAFLAVSSVGNRSAARVFQGIHISAAVVTYALWAGLALWSQRRWTRTLPGRASRLHRRLGWTVFAGLAFTFGSAFGMYWLAFIA